MGKPGPKPRNAANSRAVESASPWDGFAIPAEFDAEGIAEFRRLVAALRARGNLDATDPRMVVLAVHYYAIIQKAQKELAEADGLTFSTLHGTPLPHPMVGVITNSMNLLRGLLNDMKLSPKASKGAAAPAAKVETKWDGILNVAG